MPFDSMRNLLGWRSPLLEASPPAVDLMPSRISDVGLADDDDPIWPSARISVAEALWGEGFLFPGGGEEVLRLATPLGLSAALRLLLIGAGNGGASRRIVEAFGVSVIGYEANARLMGFANERRQQAGLGRRTRIEPWSPLAPKFPPRYFHRCMAIEVMRDTRPEPLLAAASKALKPGGQLVLLETISDLPLDPANPMVAAWAKLDRRRAELPTELAITGVLGRLGFDVRIVEDVSRREMKNAIQGWRAAVQAMAGVRPTLRQIAVVVREAELWLARLHLMRAGRLRLVRWHAVAPG